MTLINKKALVFANAALFSTLFGIQLAAMPALSYDSPHYGHAHKNYYHRPVTLKQYMSYHPKVRSAAVGAGVGTAAGALTGLLTGRGVLRGAAIGAGAGAGVGLIRSSRIMAYHPIVRDLATGAAVGGGLGWAGGRQGGTIVKSAAVGSAIGLGIGVLKHL